MNGFDRRERALIIGAAVFLVIAVVIGGGAVALLARTHKTQKAVASRNPIKPGTDNAPSGGIKIPGAEPAQDRAAQSSLKNAYTAAKVAFTDSQDWTQVSGDVVHAAEPELTVHSGPSTGRWDISYKAVDASSVVLAVKSESGNCFDLRETNNTVEYARGSCDAADVSNVSWHSQWDGIVDWQSTWGDDKGSTP